MEGWEGGRNRGHVQARTVANESNPSPFEKPPPHTLAEWLPPDVPVSVSPPLCGERLSSPSPHSAAGQVQHGGGGGSCVVGPALCEDDPQSRNKSLRTWRCWPPSAPKQHTIVSTCSTPACEGTPPLRNNKHTNAPVAKNLSPAMHHRGRGCTREGRNRVEKKTRFNNASPPTGA